MKRMWLFLVKWLLYSNLVDRHKFLGPWPIGTVFAQLLYITINIFCLVFRVSSISEAGLRAGRFTLINMIPLFVPYFSFAAAFFGASLRTYKRMHRSSGIMSFTFGILHTLIMISRSKSLSLTSRRGLFAFIVRYLCSLHHQAKPTSRDYARCSSFSYFRINCFVGLPTKCFFGFTRSWQEPSLAAFGSTYRQHLFLGCIYILALGSFLPLLLSI